MLFRQKFLILNYERRTKSNLKHNISDSGHSNNKTQASPSMNVGANITVGVFAVNIAAKWLEPGWQRNLIGLPLIQEDCEKCIEVNSRSAELMPLSEFPIYVPPRIARKTTSRNAPFTSRCRVTTKQFKNFHGLVS